MTATLSARPTRFVAAIVSHPTRASGKCINKCIVKCRHSRPTTVHKTKTSTYWENESTTTGFFGVSRPRSVHAFSHATASARRSNGDVVGVSEALCPPLKTSARAVFVRGRFARANETHGRQGRRRRERCPTAIHGNDRRTFDPEHVSRSAPLTDRAFRGTSFYARRTCAYGTAHQAVVPVVRHFAFSSATRRRRSSIPLPSRSPR